MHSSTAWRQVVLIIWDQYHHSLAPVQGCVTVSDQQYQSFLPVWDQYQAVSPSETNATLLFHRLRLWDQYKAVSQSETSRVGRIVDIQMTGIIRCTGVVCINYQKWWGLCSILQTIIWILVFLRCLFWSCILPKAVWMYQRLDKCTYCWTLFPSALFSKASVCKISAALGSSTTLLLYTVCHASSTQGCCWLRCHRHLKIPSGARIQLSLECTGP